MNSIVSAGGVRRSTQKPMVGAMATPAARLAIRDGALAPRIIIESTAIRCFSGSHAAQGFVKDGQKSFGGVEHPPSTRGAESSRLEGAI